VILEKGVVKSFDFFEEILKVEDTLLVIW